MWTTESPWWRRAAQRIFRMAREQSFIYEVEGIMGAMAEHYCKEEVRWFGRPPWATAYLSRRR